MKGFDPKFSDPPDYVLGVTKEIWEDRRIDSLKRYYGDNIIVRSPASIVVGNEGVIAATLGTLAEFPDRELLGEDVIWCSVGDGFLSSHRLICTATHTGDGAYGKASGRRFRYRILADCHAQANTIDDEWLVRDQGAIARQLGMTAKDYAAHLIDGEGGPDACVRPFHPSDDADGPYTGAGNDNPWGERLAGLLRKIMDGAFSAIPEGYDRAVETHYAGGVDGEGWRSADEFWLGLRSSFPSAVFEVHHRIGRDDPTMPARAAIRWSLTGRHDGWGSFGAPTGAEVHVMGITHAEFGALGTGPAKLRREYTLIDETAIWKQILLATG